jgi:hypothetical protein
MTQIVTRLPLAETFDCYDMHVTMKARHSPYPELIPVQFTSLPLSLVLAFSLHLRLRPWVGGVA